MSDQNKRRYHEAQVGVLGSLFLNPGLVGEVIHQTSEEHYTGEYRTLFQAIKKLFQAGRPIDAVTVLNVVGSEYRQLILDLAELTPTAANYQEYINLTLEQSRLTRLRELAMELVSAPNLDYARELVGKANGLLVDKPTMRTLNMQDGYLDFIQRQQQKPNQIPWGFDVVDRTLLAEPGDLVILGGYPSAGKTAFSLQLAWAQAKERKVGYFSLETQPEKLMDRLMSMVCDLDFGRVKHHQLEQGEWDSVAVRVTSFQDRPLDLIQASGLSVPDIQAKTRAEGYEVIYIDYLQLIDPVDKRRSDVEQVTQISKDLHTMAANTRVLVCALSQLRRPETQGDTEKAPGMSSLRQSGQIEQDADGVMLLYKEEPKQPRSRRCLKIAKNKEGESGGVVMLNFDGSKQRFSVSLSGHTQPVPRRKEPEYKQVTLGELPADEPVPFEEEAG